MNMDRLNLIIKKGYIMKRFLIAVMVLFLTVSFSEVLTAQEKPAQQDQKEEVKNEAKGEVTVVKEGKPLNAVCPVSAEEIDDPVLVKYDNKIYQLCCKSCLKKFKKDPEKYISRLSPDGKTLVKKKES